MNGLLNIGPRPVPAWMSREQLSILTQATQEMPHAPLHTPHDRNDTRPVHAATAACATCEPPKPKGDRVRDPEHYCIFRNCCKEFYDKKGDGLAAKDIYHLPVCHSYCWKLERERLVALDDGWCDGPREPYMGLWLCHRQCYMESVLKARKPDWEAKRVVPENRSLSERLRIPMLEHRFGWAPQSTKLERYIGRLEQACIERLFGGSKV